MCRARAAPPPIVNRTGMAIVRSWKVRQHPLSTALSGRMGSIDEMRVTVTLGDPNATISELFSGRGGGVGGLRHDRGCKTHCGNIMYRFS